MAKKSIPFLVFSLIIGVKIVLLVSNPASLDGVWQLSSYWSLKQGVFFHNLYTEQSVEHFHGLSMLLFPALFLIDIFVNRPVTWLYFFVFLFNLILLKKLIKPSKPFEWFLYFAIVCSPLFGVQRAEDIALLVLLLGLFLLKKKFLKETIFWCMITLVFFMVHPVTGAVALFLVVIVKFEYNQKIALWPIVLTATVVWSFYLFLNHGIYLEQLGFRTQENRWLMLLKVAPHSIPILALVALLPFRKMIWVAGVILMMFFFGKPYYMVNVLLVVLFMALYAENQFKVVRSYFRWPILILLSVNFIYYPLNPIFQCIESPHLIFQFNKVEKNIRIPMDAKKTYMSPPLAETFLDKNNIHFAIYETHQNRIITHSDPKQGDYMILESTKGKNQAFVQYDSIHPKTSLLDSSYGGPLKLSSLYKKRAAPLDVWLVEFARYSKP